MSEPAHLSDRGRGWYYGGFVPDQINFFHATYTRFVNDGSFVAPASLDLIPTGAQPFNSNAGGGAIVYLVTDWIFHAWREDAGGPPVALGRNDLTAFCRFFFLVDGIPLRMMIQTVTSNGAVVTQRSGGFPFLETRPGPQLQSVGYGVQVPVRDGQKVRATCDVIALPPGLVVHTLGFEFSGLRVPRQVWDAMVRGG